MLIFFRYGGKAKADTSHELMLAESVALVETLYWVVVDHLTVGLNSFLKKHLFGTGKLELLRQFETGGGAAAVAVEGSDVYLLGERVVLVFF